MDIVDAMHEGDARIRTALELVPPGLWQHYKGRYYQVIDLALDGDDPLEGPISVIYRPLYRCNPSSIKKRVRRVERFIDLRPVEGGSSVLRFRFVRALTPTDFSFDEQTGEPLPRWE